MLITIGLEVFNLPILYCVAVGLPSLNCILLGLHQMCYGCIYVYVYICVYRFLAYDFIQSSIQYKTLLYVTLD